jgi:hypothetical protein
VVKVTVEVIKETIKQALMTEPSPPRFRLSQLKECLRHQWFEVNEPEPDDNGEPDLMKLGHYLKGRLFEDWLASLFPRLYPAGCSYGSENDNNPISCFRLSFFTGHESNPNRRTIIHPMASSSASLLAALKGH